MRSRIVLFTRYPVPGVTKTRLIPALGSEGAADLQRQMTERTLNVLKTLAGTGIELAVRFEGGDAVAMTAWLGKGLPFETQGEGDLGDRMRRGFTDSFKEGFDRVLIIGSDCPSLGAEDIMEALDLLEDNTLVLGPSTDGGYYLIATRSEAPSWMYDLIFTDIPWGTGQVLNATMNVLAQTGLDVGLLDEKPDVDQPEDLVHWDSGAGAGGPGQKDRTELSLSVIIPVLNEEGRIGELLRRLKASDVEIVVADGGSTDRTVALCEEAEVKTVLTSKGRAAQMNAGASAATGDVFLFLHADTFLPAGFEDRVKEAVGEGSVAGAFLFGTGSDRPSMNIIENGAHFRSLRLGIVLGDQAIFATREAFYRAGAYPVQPIMEDFELWRRLGRVGKRSIIHQAALSSTRKWEKHGVLRTTLLNQMVMWLYLLGVSPERLARWHKALLRTGDG